MNNNTGVPNEIWSDRKRHLGLPISFTKYTLTPDRINIREGLFTITRNEIRLFRVLDVSVKMTLLQRLFGVGTVYIKSADETMHDFELENIADAEHVMEKISLYVDRNREKHGVGAVERME